ncbi:MAG: hypothetical protein R2710_01745 [Acidimicrobiales bacterium]
MAAPDFVPTDPIQRVRRYSSPPRRGDSWVADRPGDLTTPGMPRGVRLGTTGPDQGYAYKLVRQFDDRLELGKVHRADAVAGCVGVAMKRSALFGRGPMVHDLTAAFTLFGFLDDAPDPELVAFREAAFAEVSSHHHYVERQELIDMVPDAVLRRPHAAIIADYGSGWRKNLPSA